MTEEKHSTIKAAIYNQPWAITQDGFSLIAKAAERDMDIGALQAKPSEPLENTDRVVVRETVAVIPVTGPIFRYSNLMTRLCGATSTAVLAKDFQTALDDPNIGAIILTFDSPGGMAAGTNELADMIYAARDKKTVVAYVGECAASAAYWHASAAGRVVIDETAELGSIGVVIGYRKKDGDQTVEIVSTASPRKRLDPDSDEGRADLLQRADDLADVFISKVARNRGVAIETVLSDFGRGGMFVGIKAVQAGLADEIGSLEGLISELQTQARGIFYMDLKTFKAEHADLYDQVKAEGAAEAESKMESAVSTEKDRIVGLAGAVLGDAAGEKLSAVVESGVSVEQISALSGVLTSPAESENADQGSRQKILDGLHQAHSDGVKAEKDREKASGEEDIETQANNLAALANQ